MAKHRWWRWEAWPPLLLDNTYKKRSRYSNGAISHSNRTINHEHLLYISFKTVHSCFINVVKVSKILFQSF